MYLRYILFRVRFKPDNYKLSPRLIVNKCGCDLVIYSKGTIHYSCDTLVMARSSSDELGEYLWMVSNGLTIANEREHEQYNTDDLSVQIEKDSIKIIDHNSSLHITPAYTKYTDDTGEFIYNSDGSKTINLLVMTTLYKEQFETFISKF